MTELISIIGGSWKPKGFERCAGRKQEVMESIKRIKEGLPPIMRREAFMKEFIGTLCNAGFLERKKVSASVGQGSYTNTFDVYVRTDKGKAAHSSKAELRLPVPPAIRQAEEEERKKIELRKQE